VLSTHPSSRRPFKLQGLYAGDLISLPPYILYHEGGLCVSPRFSPTSFVIVGVYSVNTFSFSVHTIPLTTPSLKGCRPPFHIPDRLLTPPLRITAEKIRRFFFSLLHNRPRTFCLWSFLQSIFPLRTVCLASFLLFSIQNSLPILMFPS